MRTSQSQIENGEKNLAKCEKKKKFLQILVNFYLYKSWADNDSQVKFTFVFCSEQCDW